MIRASNLHRVCTNRPVNNIESLNLAKSKLSEKVTSKKMEFLEENIDSYLTTQGLMTLAKDYISERDKYNSYLKDELPVGAKTYMKELWLEVNCGFIPASFGDDPISLRKGKLVEEDAIKLVGELYELPLTKNEVRIENGFLTGEADVVYMNLFDKVIRDNKSPVSWSSFRTKIDIPTEYYWQLVGYCYLYGAKEAWLDYTLMPTPKELLDDIKEKLGEEGYNLHLQMNENILKLEPKQRVKTFKLDSNLEEDITFMLKRLKSCEEYYNNLTYNTCMNIF